MATLNENMNSLETVFKLCNKDTGNDENKNFIVLILRRMQDLCDSQNWSCLTEIQKRKLSFYKNIVDVYCAMYISNKLFVDCVNGKQGKASQLKAIYSTDLCELMTQAEIDCEDIDQNWNKETTSYIFSDNTILDVCNNLVIIRYNI